MSPEDKWWLDAFGRVGPLTMTEIATKQYCGVAPLHLDDQDYLDDYHRSKVWTSWSYVDGMFTRTEYDMITYNISSFTWMDWTK